LAGFFQGEIGGGRSWRNFDPSGLANFLRSRQTLPGHCHFVVYFGRDQNAFVECGKKVKPADAGEGD
jgi:hypothetical protein